INQSVFFALASRPNPALTDRVDVGLILASPLRHFIREVVVGRLQKLLELCALAVGEFLRLTKYPGIRAAQNVLVADADPIVEAFDDRFAADNADRAGDRRRLRHDLIGVTGDVVTAR